jgi:GH15 family glucan-1,4-alpha-glucosidase
LNDWTRTGGSVSCACAVALAALLCPRVARAGVSPYRSETILPSSNGLGAIAYDATAFKITQFLEHAYQSQNASTQSRNFVYDSYPGLRVGTTGTWLTAVTPTLIEYVPGTGIIHTLRSFSGLAIDEYHFAPMTLSENASVMLVKVTATGGTVGPVDAYSLFNYLLGSGGPVPGDDGESIEYDPSEDALYAWGPSGIAFGFASIPASSYHGYTPDNPYDSLNAGSNLADDATTTGPEDGVVGGFQQSFGTLTSGSSAWAGWFSVLAPDANAEAAVANVRTWLAGRTPAEVLSDEESGWSAWITPAPKGASSYEAALDAESQVMLRMGQVTEPGAAYGQILASIAPGEWNISWVRDMAYATVGLVQSGHYAEAKAAIAFQMGASVGGYESYVGVPYQISVVRYYGDGTEWSDSNSDGPNIEFDGFGLFLWELDEYVKASGDTASLEAWWPTVKSKVGDVLVHLQESTGLISPDSSIWEVHWDGQQRHFAYTTIAAANGLCAASRLAKLAGDTTSESSYLAAGSKSRDAILSELRAPTGAIGQSTEALMSGVEWLDASPMEAINFGLIDPSRGTALATLSAIKAGLVPATGHGFMRDDDGAWYDSQEWVFIDLRSARAFALQGDEATSTANFAWNVGQGEENFGELSELHDALTAAYEGASPMVGFGAGAYVLALTSRGTPGAPTCGTYASEPALEVDAGPDSGKPGHDGGASDAGRSKDAGTDDGARGDAGARADSGTGGGGGSPSGGCALSGARVEDGEAWCALGFGLLVGTRLRLRRRRR